MLEKLHPDASIALISGGLLVRNEELEKSIGRDVRFLNWKPSMGTQTRDFTFRIVGVQRDCQMRPCWRVLCNDGNDRFGRAAHPDAVEYAEANVEESAPLEGPQP